MTCTKQDRVEPYILGGEYCDSRFLATCVDQEHFDGTGDHKTIVAFVDILKELITE